MKHKVVQTIRKLKQRIHMPLRFRVYAKALHGRKFLHKVHLLGRICRHEVRLAVRWWRTQDEHYHWRWRALNAAAAVIIIGSIILPVWSAILARRSYELSSATQALVGQTDPKLIKQLNWDKQSQAWQFNTTALQLAKLPAGAAAAMRAQIGDASGSKTDTSTYGLDVPQDFSKGTTYTDANTSLSFSLKPQFRGNAAQEQGGHLVYPLAHNTQAIYTLKGNGLKEDIVVQHATADTMSFTYKLDLPKTLAVKSLPDGSGGIGIYSADPTLYSNASANGKSDEAALQKARENGDKTNLVFGLPSPTIKTLDGKLPSGASARFQLRGDTLTVVATGLTGIHELFTIDPSVVVTSASDFQTGGSNEGMIAFDSTNNQINRGGLTGGSLNGGTVSGTAAAIASTGAESATNGTNTSIAVPSGVTNGSLVVAFVSAAWFSATAPNDSYVTAPSGWTRGYSSVIGSSGGYWYLAWYYHWATGSDSTAYTFTAAADTSELGFIHGEDARITGAAVTSGNPFSDAPTANYGASGSAVISSFTPSSSYSLLLAGLGNLASSNSWTPPAGWTNNNYTYDSALMSTTQGTAAPTGSLTFGNGGGDYTWASVITIAGTSTVTGGWTATSSIGYGAVTEPGTAAYNGYLYALGGEGNTLYNTVQYAAINSNGTIGTWQTTASFATPRRGFGVVAYEGYLYVLGGRDTTNSVLLSDVQYAPINSDGSVGAWKTTTSLPTMRQRQGSVAYNGYMYSIGGEDSGGSLQEVDYAPINANGTLGTWTNTSALTTARSMPGSVVYNGYLYAVGGAGGGSALSTVEYAPINGDGSVGTWKTTSSMTTTRQNHQAVVYNGYIYAIGGQNNSGTNLSSVEYAQLNVNGSVGTWQTTTNLPAARQGMAATAYNGYLYSLGGYNGSNSLSEVDYAKINPAGVTSSFASATSLPSTYAVTNACSVVVNGNLYVLGGSHAGSAQTTVYTTGINNDGTLGGWATTTPLPTALYSEGCATANGYIYTVGGYTGSIGITWINYAKVNSDGTLGSWSAYSGTGAGSLPSTVYNAGVAIAGNYLYVIGGSGSNTAAVNFAQINPNGGLVTNLSSCPSSGTLSHGTWCTTSSLPAGRVDTNAVVSGGYMYEIAGYNSGATATVYYAAINSTNGTLGAWATSAQTLPTAVYWPSIVANKGSIYVIGGYTGSATTSNVYYTTIGSSGNIGAWQSGPALATGQYEAAAVVYRDVIYSIGGYTTAAQYTVLAASINNGGSGLTNAFTSNAQTWGWSSKDYIYGDKYVYQIGINNGIDYAPYKTDGSVAGSTDVADSTALNACNQDAEFELNNYIYSIGGDSCSTGVYSKLGSDGIPTGTSHMLSSVPSSDSYPSWATYNGYVYLTGSASNDTAVYYAKPGSNGDISSWSTGPTLPHESYGSGLVAYDGYLYLTGGGSTSGANTNTVAYAAINSDGSVGTWHYTSSMNQALDNQAVAYDGYLYVLGGYDGSWTAQINTEFAPILSDGSLGPWQTGPWLTSAQGYGSSGIHNGIIYAPNFDSYAPLNVIARTGQYSKVISFSSAANITSITYNGTIPGGNSAVTYQIAEADGVFGSTAPTASLSGSGGCYGNAVGVYYLRIHVTLDDSTGGAFPDNTAATANLTDLTVNYNPIHPPPNIRLRLGQTLQSGILSPFDTCIDGNSSGNNGGGGNDSGPSAPTLAWSSMAHGGGSKPSISIPANTVQAGDVVVAYMTSEDGAQSLSAPSGSGTWTTLVSDLSETYWHHSAWQSPVLTSAQATAINGHAIAGNSTHDSWSEVVAVVRGANGTRDPATASGSAAFVASAPSTISVNALSPSGANRLALIFVDEGSDAVAPGGNPALSGWTSVQSAHGTYGDTQHAVGLFSSIVSSPTSNLSITTSWPSWSGDGGYGWISVGFAPST